jgi:anti-sigma-K factor RskA
MSGVDHDRHRDDVGAYLLGALPEDEARAFEAHMRSCHVCSDELERLRVAAEAIPRGVPQVEPPPGLKARVMAEVEAAAPPESTARREGRRGRLPGLAGVRLRTAWAAAAVALVLAVAAGFGAAQLVDDDGSRTIAATVDETRAADAEASVTIDDDGRQGGVLRMEGFPPPEPGQTYQAWVSRGAEVSPQPTFEVDPGGRATVAIPADLSGADAILVTREPMGGSRTPSEQPLLRAAL